MSKEKPHYVGVLTPKLKGSTYGAYVLKPYLDTVKWSKQRAEKELRFHMKNGVLPSGLKVREVYFGKVIREEN